MPELSTAAGLHWPREELDMKRNLSFAKPFPASFGGSFGSFFRASGGRKLAILLLAGLFLGGCDSSPTEPCPRPVNFGGNILRPEKISAPQPQYTEEARQARIQGTVILQLTIDCRGDVTDIVVIRGLPLGLTEASIAAVRNWRFRPATLNGRPVSVFYNVTVNFRLV